MLEQDKFKNSLNGCALFHVVRTEPPTIQGASDNCSPRGSRDQNSVIMVRPIMLRNAVVTLRVTVVTILTNIETIMHDVVLFSPEPRSPLRGPNLHLRHKRSQYICKVLCRNHMRAIIEFLKLIDKLKG